METITQWAILICLAAVACVLLELFSPKGVMEKNMRFVLGLFMLCAVVFPLRNGLQVDLQLPSISTRVFDLDERGFEEKTNEQIIALGEMQIQELAKACLEKMNIQYKKIDVNMDTGQDNSISIVLVTVTIDIKDKDKKAMIKQTLENELGADVKVYTEGSE